MIFDIITILFGWLPMLVQILFIGIMVIFVIFVIIKLIIMLLDLIPFA